MPRYFKNEIVGMMWVALAGPISNCLLALWAAQLIKLLIRNQLITIDQFVIEVLYITIIINLVLLPDA